MQQVNNAYSLALQSKPLAPVYLLEIDGVPTHFSTGPVLTPTATTKTWMTALTGAGASITIYEGRTSIGSLSFMLLDKNAEITKLNFQYQMANRIITLLCGFADIPESKYVPLFKGRILNYTFNADAVAWNYEVNSLITDQVQNIFTATTVLTVDAGSGDATLNVEDTSLFPAATAGVLYVRIGDEAISYTGKTGTTFTGCTRGALGTVAATHATGDEARNLAVLQGNPATLALQILTSTGAGTNGTYDVLPKCCGLAIDQTLIDVAKFESERDRWLNGLLFKFEESASAVGKQFLEEQIYTFSNSYPTTNNQGLISYKVYAPPLPDLVTPVLDDKDLISKPTFEGNVLHDLFFNEVDLSYDYDFVSGNFLTRLLDEDINSQTLFGVTKTQPYQSRGMRTGTTGQKKIDRFTSRFLRRFSVPSPQIRSSAFYRRRLLELADVIPFSSAFLPDISRGVMGVNHLLLELVNCQPDFIGGSQEYTLLQTGYSYGRKYAAISPSSGPPVNFPVFSLATAAQRNYAFVSKKVSATVGIMADGTDGYYITD